MSLPTLDNDDNKRKKPGGLPMIDMTEIDLEESNEFEEVSVNKALYETGDEEINGEIYDGIKIDDSEREIPSMNDTPEETVELESDYYPEYEKELEEEDEAKFIDKEKKKLIPFGGRRSKRKSRLVKSSDFDDRKNNLAKTKIMQFGVIILMILFFLIGLKNTFSPSHVYTDEEIRQFAAEGAGQTGFPEDRGRFFVENFMDSYLNLDKTKPELLQVLSQYYGKGAISNSGYAGLNMDWNHETKQKVLVSPKVFEVDLLNEYSAQYKVSAYVTDTDGKLSDGKGVVGRWLTFSVNTYYNEEDDSLAITPDSPTIIPNKNIGEQSSVPTGATLGTGEINKEILPAISPTIDGFVESFARSSLESHDSVVQYIDNKDDISLYDGFGGRVRLAGEPEDSIKKVVYNVGEEGNQFEVDVTVKWLDSASIDNASSIEYTSRYQMSIRANSEGKFTVTSFSPFTYYK